MKMLLSVFLASAAILAADAKADEQAVRQMVEKFNDAARSGDAAALEKMLGADLVYVHSSAKVENKAECVAALKATPVDFKVHPGLRVKLYGATALVHGQMTALPKGQTATVPLDIIQVWAKQGNNWVMVGRHTARLPQQ
jgi:ketosteroid isomerase-like protein